MASRVQTLWAGLAVGAGLWLGTGSARAQGLFENPACGPNCNQGWLRTKVQACADKRATICEPRICPQSCFGYFRTQWTPWAALCPEGPAGCAPVMAGQMVTHPAAPPMTHPAVPMVTHPAPPAPLPSTTPPTNTAPPPKRVPQSSSVMPPRSVPISIPASQPVPLPDVPKVSVNPPARTTAPAAPSSGPLPPAKLQDRGSVLPPVPVVPTVGMSRK